MEELLPLNCTIMVTWHVTFRDNFERLTGVPGFLYAT